MTSDTWDGVQLAQKATASLCVETCERYAAALRRVAQEIRKEDPQNADSQHFTDMAKGAENCADMIRAVFSQGNS